MNTNLILLDSDRHDALYLWAFDARLRSWDRNHYDYVVRIKTTLLYLQESQFYHSDQNANINRQVYRKACKDFLRALKKQLRTDHPLMEDNANSDDYFKIEFNNIGVVSQDEDMANRVHNPVLWINATLYLDDNILNLLKLKGIV